MKTIPTPPTNSFNADTRVLVLGARGMLGSDCVRYLGATVIPYTRVDLDVTDSEAVLRALREVEPEVVINATAYTQVDLAEAERMQAELLNAHVPGFIARACQEVGAVLVHFSTDQVFDGETESPYTERDTPRPLNWYARTKLAGEKAVLDYDQGLVLRVQWLYGEAKDRFSVLRDKSTFTPFADQVGAPTWTRDIVQCLSPLLAKQARGLYHFSYDDHGTWADVFSFVKDHWDLSVDLEPRKTATFDLPAKRPLFAALSNGKLKAKLGVDVLGSWRDSLKTFLDLRT